MDDKLTFDNLHELLDKFASVNDTNKKYAGAIRSRIDHGMYKIVQSAISILSHFYIQSTVSWALGRAFSQ